MAELPSGVVTATFVGSLVPAADPPIGWLWFTPVGLEKSSAEKKIILPRPVKAAFSDEGTLSVQLVATNATDIIPTNWYYWVTPFILGSYVAPFPITLNDNQTLDISDSLFITPVPVEVQTDLLGRLSAYGPAAVGMAWSYGGVLIPTQGAHRFYNDTGKSVDIASVRATVNIPPTGSPAIIDVSIDGVSIFTDQDLRPTIAEGELTNLSSFTGVRMIWPAGSYLTVDIDEVGSINPGEDLTVNVVFV